MGARFIVLDRHEDRFKRKALPRILAFIENCSDFYQLLSLAVVLEARLSKIKPQGLSLERPCPVQTEASATS